MFQNIILRLFVHPEYLYIRAPSSKRKCKLFSWLTETHKIATSQGEFNTLVWKAESIDACIEYGFTYCLKKVIHMTHNACTPFLRILPLQVGFIFSFDILILANHNLSFFPNILVNILCFLLHEIHIFALRWRNESKRSSQLRTLLN